MIKKLIRGIGICMIVAGIALGAEYKISENRAELTTGSIAEQVQEQIESEKITTVEIDGYTYIGMIDIPRLGLKLPVMETCSDEQLKIAPCLYYGEICDKMIIAAHSYPAHFGKIGSLNVGDEIVFTDVNLVKYKYTVCETEYIGTWNTRKMVTGDWDLTLFTCTRTARSRITVRCMKAE